MYKVIALLKKRDDLSHEAFVTYYESNHAPLILGEFPWIKEYRRNYVQSEGAVFGSGVNAVGCDVVTEILFESEKDYQRMMTAYENASVASRIENDEANFLDRSATRFFAVQTHSS